MFLVLPRNLVKAVFSSKDHHSDIWKLVQAILTIVLIADSRNLGGSNIIILPNITDYFIYIIVDALVLDSEQFTPSPFKSSKIVKNLLCMLVYYTYAVLFMYFVETLLNVCNSQ